MSKTSVELDMATRQLTSKRQKVQLRNKEYILMDFFLKNVGKVVSRTELLEKVWDRNICCATNTVDVHVSRLRRKLASVTDHNLIKTVHCVGYIFQPQDLNN